MNMDSHRSPTRLTPLLPARRRAALAYPSRAAEILWGCGAAPMRCQSAK